MVADYGCAENAYLYYKDEWDTQNTAFLDLQIMGKCRSKLETWEKRVFINCYDISLNTNDQWSRWWVRYFTSSDNLGIW